MTDDLKDTEVNDDEAQTSDAIAADEGDASGEAEVPANEGGANEGDANDVADGDANDAADAEGDANDAADVAEGDANDAADVTEGDADDAADVAEGDANDAADVAEGDADASDVADGDANAAADVAEGDADDAADVAEGDADDAADVAEGDADDAADVADGDADDAADVADGDANAGVAEDGGTDLDDDDNGAPPVAGAQDAEKSEGDEAYNDDDEEDPKDAEAEAPPWLESVLESLILCSTEPVTAGKVREVLSMDREDVPVAVIRRSLKELVDKWNAPDRPLAQGLRLMEVGGGVVIRTAPHTARFMHHLRKQKPARLSKAALETLAIIAYRQPVTRPQMEDVRGVDCSGAVKNLLERGLIRVLGKADDIGRPLLYGTTRAFLEFFNLKALSDLPTLRELHELDGIHEPEALPDESDDAPVVVRDLFDPLDGGKIISSDTEEEGEKAIAALEAALGTAAKVQKSAAALDDPHAEVPEDWREQALARESEREQEAAQVGKDDDAPSDGEADSGEGDAESGEGDAESGEGDAETSEGAPIEDATSEEAGDDTSEESSEEESSLSDEAAGDAGEDDAGEDDAGEDDANDDDANEDDASEDDAGDDDADEDDADEDDADEDDAGDDDADEDDAGEDDADEDDAKEPEYAARRHPDLPNAPKEDAVRAAAAAMFEEEPPESDDEE